MVKMIMPKMGESVAEATILKWLKKEGDRVDADEPVLEIATDKVDSEVPSPAAGILSKRLFEEGQVVKVGEVIAMIESESEQKQAPSKPSPAPVERDSQPVMSNGSANTIKTVSTQPIEKFSDTGRFYSPLVRNIARERGVSMSELETLKGSGANNRLTKQDLLKHLEERGGTTIAPAPETKLQT